MYFFQKQKKKESHKNFKDRYFRRKFTAAEDKTE